MKEINFSWSSILRIFSAIILLYVLYLIRDIIIWFIFALVISILFNFLIDSLERKKIPRFVSAFFLYFVSFAILGFFVFKSAPLMLSEVKDFNENLPIYLNKISPFFEELGIEIFKSKDTFLSAIQKNLESAQGGFFNALFVLFGGAASTILVISLAFFMSWEGRTVERIFDSFVIEGRQEYLANMWRRARKKVSGWFLSRIAGMIFVGICTFIVLTIFKVRYSLAISLLAGFLDFIPIIGPFFGGILIFAIAGLDSFWRAVLMVACFILIQQLENNLLLPLLSKKFLNIPPVLMLVSLAIGAKLWGIPGAILAIPLGGVIFEVVKDYLFRLKRRREIENQATGF